MNERLNIVFASDRNYIQHLSVALVSLLVNNRELAFTVYIVSSGMTPKDRRNIDEIVKGYDCEVRHLTVSDDLFVTLATEHPMYPKGIYYRLLIPSLIDAEKVLYLDSDIVVNGSIRELYDAELGDAYIGAIEDPGFDRHDKLRMDKSAVYFNSGMMLIDLGRWKKTGLQKQVIEFIEKHPDDVWFPDQDGLNSVINGRWKKMPLKFNQFSSLFDADFESRFDCFGKEELLEARTKPVIIHYSSGSKPWHFKNRHPYKSYYWKYLKMTPYRHAIYTDLRPAHLLKSMIPKTLKSSIKKLLKKQAG